jgi:hypothetical protein
MRPWLIPARRTVEALADQVVATGGGLGGYGRDPIDGDVGYRRAGTGNREVPYWTRERARDYSVTAYRANPMATAIIDTYTSFCVGDSGVKWQATNDEVAKVVREFWDDPANKLGSIQEISLRSQLLMGEKLYELMVGAQSGAVRFAPVEPALIKDIRLRAGNPLWPSQVVLPGEDDDRIWNLVQVDDATGLRAGQAMFWAPWRTLDTDTRGMPFLTPVLDDLDSYATVLSNLIDRTALARYMVWDVTVKGGQTEVDAFLAGRKGNHVPPSGSVEVHNDGVTWEPKTVSTGAAEDTVANRAVLTNIAGGTGLAKTWLAEPEDSNRATSQSMAEPVRRRVGGIQRVWLEQQTEFCRFAVDQAVASGRLQRMVTATDPRTGEETEIPASQAVIVTGPEIAASDSQLTAQVLLNLSTGLEKLQQIGALSPEAAATAARKAWEDYVGVPYVHELDSPAANPDDLADVVESAQHRSTERHRAGGGSREYVRDGDGKFSYVSGGHIGGPVAAQTKTAGAVADPLKLAGRIQLAADEKFGGSARVAGDGQTLVMARVDGPAGMRIRLGVVYPEHTRSWQGANKGRTVELDEASAQELHEVVKSAQEQGRKSVADYRTELRAAAKAGTPLADRPDAEAQIASGVISASWGDLNWSVQRDEGDDYEVGGEYLGPGGSWSLGLDPAPTGSGSRDPFYANSPSEARKIDKALSALLGS